MGKQPKEPQPGKAVALPVEGSRAVIVFSGEVGALAEESILKAYQESASIGAAGILLRFAPGCTLNSAGIAVLILVVSQARKAKFKVGAVGLSPHYQKIFQMIGLTDYLTIFPSEEDAKKLV